MTKNSYVFRKGIVIGIIILFLGASVIPVIGVKELKNMFFSSEGETTLVKSNSRITGVSDWCCDCDIIVPDDYPTIQEAIDAANQGDCICVRNGKYYENIVIEGADKNGITLCGEDNRNITIIDGKNDTHVITVQSANDVTITGFSITNSSREFKWVDGRLEYIFYGICIEKSKRCSIYGNIIFKNGNGIKATDRDSMVFIENNSITRNRDNGIIVSYSAVIIESNYIAENGFKEEGNNGDGIEIRRGTLGVEIRNNTIEHNRVDGIWDDTGDVHKIIGNKIYYNGHYGISLYEGSNCVMKDNIIHDNVCGIYLYAGVGNDVLNNNICDNEKFGICLLFAPDVTINYNNIYENGRFDLIALMSTGAATWNWWGSGGGISPIEILRILLRTPRLPPIIDIFPASSDKWPIGCIV